MSRLRLQVPSANHHVPPTNLAHGHAGRMHAHRLGWIRLGYGEITEKLRVPSDHLEVAALLRQSVLKLALFRMTI
jgi:hypothetical protein